MSLLAQNILLIFACALVYTTDHHAKLYQMFWKNLEKLLSLLTTDLHQMLCKCHELLKLVDLNLITRSETGLVIVEKIIII